jgi:hypothetical protein
LSRGTKDAKPKKDSIGPEEIEVSYDGPQRGGLSSFTVSLPSMSGLRRIDIAMISSDGFEKLARATIGSDGKYHVDTRLDGVGEYAASVAVYHSSGIVIKPFTFRVEKVKAEPSQKPVKPAKEPKAPRKEKTPKPAKESGSPGKISGIPNPPKPPKEILETQARIWPISSNYSQALQNLKFSIPSQYSHLLNAKLQPNPNVKMKSYVYGSGNFGTVFKASIDGKNWALKLFTRASPDIAERYFYISWYLSLVKHPFLVNFNYHPSAVRVMNKPKEYFPLLMLEWVEGITLNQFIERNLGDRAMIEKAAKSFLEGVMSLQDSGIAHGDLSGDNIIVSPTGDITFIDYDGMFVPPLKGKTSSEKGHEHFQHPRRGDEFNQSMDNFSALVIYLSLRAVAEDRKFWGYNQSDSDRLIFQASDFIHPGKSKVFSDLLKGSKRLRANAELLAAFCSHDSQWKSFSLSQIT